MNRVWAMPSSETFSIAPIRDLVGRYMRGITIDPFARNRTECTYTNDINPNTKAQHHMDALDFLKMLRGQKVVADTVLFDPPYNPSQAKQCYEEIGIPMSARIGKAAGVWREEKNVVCELLRPGGHFLWFGWNSCGMGATRGFEFVEILLVAHGRGHHDTICTVEKRKPDLFDAEAPDNA